VTGLNEAKAERIDLNVWHDDTSCIIPWQRHCFI